MAEELVGGRFRVLAHLGSGGMASVFRARDEATGKLVALKRLSSGGEGAGLRFRREFHTLAGLSHPRIVQVFEFGVDPKGCFYTMELLEGRELRQLGRVEPARACALLRDLAAALAFLHTRQLLHRDVAPRNVWCTQEGRAKLLDFGLLASPGVPLEVAGTAPMMSPEAVYAAPLDHRTDLYGLGALAYWLLTGEHAYPVKSAAELRDAWRHRPLPPSAKVPEIAPGLDDLVLSLLQSDARARPSSAAEVIDRLTVLGKLPPEPELEHGRGYLSSALFVGRSRELSQVRAALKAGPSSQGGAFMVEAPSGTGKSRFLREVGLEGQLAGHLVVRAAGESADRGPYGVIRELAAALLDASPAEALSALGSHGPLLESLVPELASHVAKPARDSPTVAPSRRGDPAGERALTQSALVEWLERFSQLRPLVLLVDDVQRADEASAAVLVALCRSARELPLVVLMALRTDERIRARGTIEVARDASVRLRLRGLDAAEIEALVRALVGDVPKGPRLASWMSRVSGGSPLLCTELARHLIETGVLRYLGGTWVVPEELGLTALPEKLEAAIDARLGTLSPTARSVAEALAVLGRDASLELAVSICQPHEEAAVFEALDTLCAHEVVQRADEHYRLRHDALREGLLRRLDPERRRALHLLIGETLEAGASPGSESEMEVGWHLLRGGKELAGARRLENAGRRLFEAQSLQEAVPPFEAALEVYERSGVSPELCLELRRLLVHCGSICDRNLVFRYGESTIQALYRHSGVDVAARLGPYLGRPAALGVGLIAAYARWALTRRPSRGPKPIAALIKLLVVCAYASSSFSYTFQPERIEELKRLLWPVSFLKKRLLYAQFLITQMFQDLALGRYAPLRDTALQVLRIFEEDKASPVSEIDRRNAQAGMWCLIGKTQAVEMDPAHEGSLAKMEEMNLLYFELAGMTARASYHRFRGEEDRAREYDARAELHMVRLGSFSVTDSQRAQACSMAYALTRDTLGLKRVIEDLTRYLDAGYRFEAFLRAAKGDYLRERGELAASRAELERGLEEVGPERGLRRLCLLTALTETLLASRDFEAFDTVSKEALAMARSAEHGLLAYRVRVERAMALAEAARGSEALGLARLRRVLDEVQPAGSPTLSGFLHEAAARLAIVQGNRVLFDLHRGDVDVLFRGTGNPALIAIAERLSFALPAKGREAAPRLGVVTDDSVTMSSGEARKSWVSSQLRSCRGRVERVERALELVLESTSARAGFLFFRRRDGGVELAAPASGEPPPESFKAFAEALLSGARLVSPGLHLPDAEGWQAELLQTLGDAAPAAGVVFLREAGRNGGGADARPLVSELAQCLAEAGDLVTATEGASDTRGRSQTGVDAEQSASPRERPPVREFES